jgi:ribulose kinase
MSSESYYIGVDVGTGSARASLVKQDGTVLSSSTQETITYRDPNDHRIFEQSTNNIWAAISTAIKDILAESKVSASNIKGLGFDATCSLAVTDLNGEPVVITGGETLGSAGDRNIVLWADHRAEKEAEIINSTESIVLNYVGGTMSVRSPTANFGHASSHILYPSSRWNSQKSSG